MNLKHYVIAAISIAATGCATTGEMRSREPVVNERSAVPANDVVVCASDALSNRRVVFSVLPRQNGSSITLGQTADADMVADILNVDGQTNITVYRMPRMYFGLSRSFINTVLECAKLPTQP